MKGNKISPYTPFRWHVIAVGNDYHRVPYWVQKKMGLLPNSPEYDPEEVRRFEEPDDPPDWRPTEIEYSSNFRGNHYEYKCGVVDVGGTHDNAILRRKLSPYERRIGSFKPPELHKECWIVSLWNYFKIW